MDGKARQTGTGDAPRYGDYPELFWDAEPDALLDVSEPTTLARLLTRADPRTIGELVSPDLIAASLDDLPVPENVKLFWRLVLGRADGETATVGS